MKIDPHKPPAGLPPQILDDTGAGGLGGGNVDPSHELIYTGKWPFGDPRNQPLTTDYQNYLEIDTQMPTTAGGQFDNIHPFKLQHFTEDPEEGEEEGERKLRIYTGMLTVLINNFVYSEDKDTDTTYDCSISLSAASSYSVCFSFSCFSTSGSSSGSSSGSGCCDHSHEGSACIEIPEHTHEIVCDLDDTPTDVDKFLTIGGQPEILAPEQIEPEGFEPVKVGEDQLPSGYRAQILPRTYGSV